MNTKFTKFFIIVHVDGSRETRPAPDKLPEIFIRSTYTGCGAGIVKAKSHEDARKRFNVLLRREQ